MTPVEKPELNGESSEEGNYIQTVSRVEPQRVRRNNLDEEIERNGCKYKDFMVVVTPNM